MRTPKGKSSKKRPVTEEVKRRRAEKRQQVAHQKSIRSIFINAGFSLIASMEGKEFEFRGAKSDFDDVFILENILIIAEYTVSNQEKVENHLLKKAVVYKKCKDEQDDFVSYLRANFAAIQSGLKDYYTNDQVRPIFVYCSKNELKETTKSKADGVKYLEYINARYFQLLTNTIKRSAKYELLDFLGISPRDYADNIIRPQSSNTETYECSILPTANSHFDAGYKVITFYVDADALLKRAYVLRRGGWRTGGNIYQRMIDRRKVEAIRKHLTDNKGVFINNIIATLPNNTKLLNADGNTVDTNIIKKTESGIVQLSTDFNSIGIIDGQHRVFSYHEGGTKDLEVAKLRKQQNLLVTGVMFPQGLNESGRVKFEARLFLDINSNQSNARADLKQEIGLILRPFAPASVARQVLNQLNEGNGPLNGEFQRFFWEKDKLKTTTIVSYGLIPLVRIEGGESLFSSWSSPNKADLTKQQNEEALHEYIDFCAKNISLFISALRSCLSDKRRWTAQRDNPDRLLTTTIINGMIACVRRLANNGKLGDFDFYKSNLREIDKFNFRNYRTNDYNKLGVDLAERYFAVSSS